MTLTHAFAGLALAAAGYLIGRYRPVHRALDWANWQNYGKRPTGLRYAAVFALISAENLGLIITHPKQSWHTWQHRNDPPPPRSPAPTFDPDWAAKRRAAANDQET